MCKKNRMFHKIQNADNLASTIKFKYNKSNPKIVGIKLLASFLSKLYAENKFLIDECT